MNYSVLIEQFPFDQLDAVAGAVSRVYGIPDFDARARIRKGWGFLEREATAERARQIADGLTAAGVPARAIDNEEMRSSGEPQVMTGFTLDAQGFTPQPQDPRTPVTSIPWPELSIVAAGGFSEDVIRRDTSAPGKSGAAQLVGLGVFLVTGLPVGIFGGGKKKDAKPVKTSRFISFGEIITTSGAAWFFNPESFDFTGFYDAKQLNVTGNFRQLIATLAQSCRARLNYGAALVCDHKPLTLANYHSLRDFETEMLWMMNAPVR